MRVENIHFSSKTIEISESDTVLHLRSRLCYYGDKNMNEVILPSDTANEFAQSLINMPVQAKVIYNPITDQETFGGHEARVNPIDGDLALFTESIGVHTGVEIKEELVETVGGEYKTLPCLYADYVIWKRYPQVVEIVKRLHNENRLHSSWELQSSEYSYDNGVKTLISYQFIGNCLLGEGSIPAYGNMANCVSLSQLSNDSPELLVAQALSADICALKNKEEVDNLKDVKKKTEISEEEVKVEESVVKTEQAESETETQTPDETTVESVESEEATVETEEAPQSEEIQAEDTNTSEEKVEISALTENDLRRKIEKKLEKKTDGWAYVAWLFPGENTAWVKDGRAESELEYLLVTYSVLDDDVEISEPKRMKLTASLMEMDRRFSEMNSAIAEANSTIQTLNTEISNLTVFKEKFEASEQERIEAELAEKQNGLKDYAISSGLIAEDEVESDETIKTAISSVDKASIDAIIAERFMASKAEKKEKSEKNVEVSESSSKSKAPNIKVNIVPKVEEAVSEFRSTFFKK